MEIWALALFCTAAAAGVLLVQAYAERRAVIARTLETFAGAFVREFERPLVEVRGTRAAALRTQVKVRAARGTVEVRLAPAGGRRYPNLSDHRSNVEYDIYRVMSLLDDRRFRCASPVACGAWVSIRIRLMPGSRKEGAA